MKLRRRTTEAAGNESGLNRPFKRTPAQLLTDYSLHIAILLLAAFCTFKYPLFIGNMPVDLIKRVASYSLISLAMGCVMLMGETDLSAGHLLGLVGFISWVLIDKGLYYYNDLEMPDPNLLVMISVTLAIIIGLAVGLLNGVFVTRMRVPSFVSTFAMQIILHGTLLAVSGLGLFERFQYRSNSAVLREAKRPIVDTIKIGKMAVPHYVWYALGAFLIMWFVWNRSKLGRNMRSVGRNRAAAEAEGVNVKRTVTAVFVLAGLLVGLSGFIETVRVGGMWGAGGVIVVPITACLLGGMSLKGGRGRIGGIFVGLAFYQLLMVCIQWIGIWDNWVYLIIAAVIFISAALSANRDKRERKQSPDDTVPPEEAAVSE